MKYDILDTIVEAQKEEMIANLQKWISYASVQQLSDKQGAPFGAITHDLLEEALKDARSCGFATYNVDGYCGEISMNKGGEQKLGILCHLDVVPAGEGWTHDPWGGEIVDGKLYGRGTVDDKGPAICALYAMRAVKQAGIPLKDEVRLILGCDEETGMSDMRYYAAHRDLPDYGFSPDANFPVINIEKGGLGLELSAYTGEERKGDKAVLRLYAGERANVVPGVAKAVLMVDDIPAFRAEVEAVAQANGFHLNVEENADGTITLTAVGVGAHASLPHLGVNAAGMLLIALKELGAGNASKNAIAALADKIGLEYTGAKLGVAQSDELSGALTCNLGLLRYDGHQITATLDIRYPLCADEKDMCGAVAMALSENRLAVTRTGGHVPHHVPADHKVVRGLLKVYEEVTGNEAYTIAIGGGTYSRTMPNTVAFGMSFPGDVDTCHMPDEFIDLDKMLQSTKIFAHAIAELAGE